MLIYFLPLLLIVCCSYATADEWGSIGGQIIVEGEIPERIVLIAKDAVVKDKEVCSAEEHLAEDLIVDRDSRGLANVFLYLAKKPKSIHPDFVVPPKDAVQFSTRMCQFVPHCLICRTDQSVEFRQGDAVAHYTHPNPLKNPAKAILVATYSTEPQIFVYSGAESVPMRVNCDFHPWMRAYWLMIDHPYAALTDKDGKFQIDNLPVGEHSFRIWHERFGDINKKYKVSVTAGDRVELPAVSVSLDKLTSP